MVSPGMKSAFLKAFLAGILTFSAFACISTSQAGAAVTFGPTTNFATGTTPYAVITGDFNGDGKTDLATPNSNSDNVSILIGDGSGGFTSATAVAVGAGPRSITKGDFNGDGKTDLAVANIFSSDVSILIGDGAGGFTSSIEATTGSFPGSITSGDFNGDGKTDLATSNSGSNNVSILIGDGAGGFTPHPTLPAAGPTPYSITTGDFNGDGKADLATTNAYANTVTILTGDGTGGFTSAFGANTGSGPHSIITGDFNGDGKADLATSNVNVNNVSILTGDGLGGFTSAIGGTTGSSAETITKGDFNSDGKTDLASANMWTQNVSILTGNGAGSFASAIGGTTGTNPNSITSGDFNGDGAPDLVTTNQSSNNVSVLLNTTDETPPNAIIDTATPASPANTGVRTFTFHSVDPAPSSTPITFECRIDGGAWFPCSSGYATPNLADGNHTVDIRAKDGAGNIDPTPASSTWVVDKTPPNTFIDSATPASPTNNQVRNFTYHGVDPAPGTPITLECRLDGGAWFTAGCNGTYNTGVLPEGNHTFEVRATDAAGNVDPTPATSTWMIDLTNPDISITTPSVRARYTLGQNVPPVFNCTDPLHGGPPAVASGIQSCTSNGIHTGHLGNFHFTVTARDHAGNQSEKTVVYAVDPPKYNDLIDPHHPIAYYRLGDPLGATTMTDSSGNHNDGEYKNEINLRRPPAVACHVRPHAPYTCDLNADPQDWSATFPARDGYGFTNNVVAPKTAYTWEAWINRSDNNAGSIAGQGGAGQLFVNSDGKLALRQTQDTVTSSGPVLTPGQWFHVAATWNGSVTRLYVNGNQVGSSNSANKPPSGTSTLYVGYGDQAPWFHGSIDEVAYYGSALPGGAFATRYEVGTAHDVPSPVSPPAPASASLLDLAIQRPSADIGHPNNGGLYAPTKVPVLHFHCEDLDGDGTVTSCTATVDGIAALDGSALPDTPGVHTVVATAVDNTGLTRSHTHTYTVKGFQDIYNTDSPLVYYRLGDANGAPMKDSGPNHIDGIYKNAQESGSIGISGDLDRARRFFGSSGYGYAQNIQAPRFSSTIEVWVNPEDRREQSIVGHGDAGEIYIGTDGTLNYRHMGVTVTAPGIPAGVFTQVVGVWDGTSIFLYVNGHLAGQAEATRRPSSSSTFYVGYGEIRPWFKGSLDEVAYYAKALTPNRIMEHFLADPPPPVSTFDDDPAVDPPETTDPGNPSTEPDDGDDPVTEPGDDPSTEPGDDPSTEPGDDPSTEPDDGDDPGNNEAGNDPKAYQTTGTTAKGKRLKAKKCKTIRKKAKRKACLKRVSG